MSGLDCVVIGYNDADFEQYRLMCLRAGAASPELQIFRKEHLVLNGRAMPWLEAFSTIRNRATGRSDRYHPGEVYNLASLYLTNYVRRNGLRAEPVSLFSGELDRLTDLLAERPTVVAITTTFYVNVLPVLPIVQLVRERAPTAHIVVGGPLVDNLCQDGLSEGRVTPELADLLDVMGADTYVRESQGERTLTQLCRALAAGEGPDRVPNLLVGTDDGWRTTRRLPEANDLDEWSIDWSQFSGVELGPTVQTRTARSCAFKCSFCDYPARAGALTTASVDTIRRELRQIAALGARSVVFVDDTFNVPPKRFKALCRMMIEEDLGLSWYSYFRCSNARDEETFDLAAASGCAGVFLGIESADIDVLAAMHKLAQDDQYREGLRRFGERDITTFASIIVGFPGETTASVQRTVEFLNETRPTFWRAQAWWANPRSPIYARREALGIEGSAYDWSHRTMTAPEAARLCDVMFERVTGSTWLPLYDFDFWSLPYLSGKGVGHRTVRGLLETTQRHLHARDADPADAGTAARELRELEKAIAGLSVEPARYRQDILVTT
jgi:radical SAM PhpK family P-methyltransferase